MKTRSLLFIFLVLVLLSAGTSSANNIITSYEYHNDWLPVTGNTPGAGAGESITLDKGYNVTAIEFYMTSSSTSSTLRAAIYNATGTVGTSASPDSLDEYSYIVRSDTITASEITEGWNRFNLTNVTYLPAGDYSIGMLTVTRESGTTVSIARDTANTTYPGNYYYRYNDGDSWSTAPNDVAFRIYTTDNVTENESPEPATEYYVSPTGDNGNNGTTAESAWQTLSYSFSELTANDTLYVMPGNYHNVSTPLRFSNSGTADAPITVTSYSGRDTVSISGNDTGADIIDSATAGGIPRNYIIIENLSIYDSGVIRIDSAAHDWTIRNNHFERCNSIGAMAENVTIESNTFVAPQWSFIQISQWTSEHFSKNVLIKNNTVTDMNYPDGNVHGGLDLMYKWENVTFENNTMYGGSTSAIYIHQTTDYDSADNGLIIRNNNISDTTRFFVTERRVGNVTIEENTFSDIVPTASGGSYLDFQHGYGRSSHISVRNNTFVAGSDLSRQMIYWYCNESTFENNTVTSLSSESLGYEISLFGGATADNTFVDTDSTDNTYVISPYSADGNHYVYYTNGRIFDSSLVDVTINSSGSYAIVEGYSTADIITLTDYSLLATSATLDTVTDTGCNITLSSPETVTFGEITTGNTTTVDLSVGTSYITFSQLDFVDGDSFIITSFFPTATTPSIALGDSLNFTVSTSKTATIKWYSNGDLKVTTNDKNFSYYDKTPSSAGEYNVTAIATDGVDTVSQTWTLTVTEAAGGSDETTSNQNADIWIKNISILSIVTLIMIIAIPLSAMVAIRRNGELPEGSMNKITVAMIMLMILAVIITLGTAVMEHMSGAFT